MFRLQRLLTTVSFCVNRMQFEMVAAQLVTARALIHSFAADPIYRQYSLAFPKRNVNIVDS